MKTVLCRYFAFLGAAVLLGMTPWAWSQAQAPSESAPTRLSERHPATLAGRMDRVQTGYVDLYAPLTASECRRIEAVAKSR